MSWFDNILYPLMVAVAWIMVQFHAMLDALGMDGASGGTWALSIVGLVVVMRIILIPLFVKQIKASRGMQLLAPDMQKIQKKYKGKTDPASREAMSRETMELYRKHGTNPFSSCLPILAQSPIFFALFRVLYSMPQLADGSYPRESVGPLTQEVAQEFTDATLFGARLSDWFLASDDVSVKVLAAILILAMSATTFFTQRQLTRKNMPASALQGPMAQQQKMLLYVLPLVFAVSGVNFPIGVLIYWTTTNVWSMGQQFYVIRRNPTPGSEAERLLKERRARKAAARGIVLEEETPAVEEKPRGQRQQPKRKDRAKPTTAAPGTPDAASAGGSSATDDGTDGAPAAGAAASGGARATGAAKAPGTTKRSGTAKTSGAGKAGGAGKASGAAKAPGGKAAGATKPAGGGKAAGSAKASGGGTSAGGGKPAGGGGGKPARASEPSTADDTTPTTGSGGDGAARKPRRPGGSTPKGSPQSRNPKK